MAGTLTLQRRPGDQHRRHHHGRSPPAPSTSPAATPSTTVSSTIPATMTRSPAPATRSRTRPAVPVIGGGTNSFTNSGTLKVAGDADAAGDRWPTPAAPSRGPNGTLDLTGSDTVNNGALNDHGQINVNGAVTIENEAMVPPPAAPTSSAFPARWKYPVARSDATL